MNVNEPELASAAGMNRRTVIKAAAWSAPVIAVAIATPLAAASVLAPRPAPAGLTEWQGGTSIATSAAVPAYVAVNRTANVGFFAFTPDGEDLEPDGTFTSGTATVTVQWGAGGTVTTPTSYRLEETNLNGWTRVGSVPAPGTTGAVEYRYPGILNGASNVVSLPVLRLYPTAGGSLTPTYVSTVLSADNMSEKTSGARVP
ncbi:MAG: hypothetical protein P0Y60_11240 [Candidatus Microbacterium colombiense]|nr:MAG: hypothetical protein P0Y60_11240 [Microbacterium sp.]